jgi:hypothetical protein
VRITRPSLNDFNMDENLHRGEEDAFEFLKTDI